MNNIKRVCSVCGGTKVMYKSPCGTCNGTGEEFFSNLDSSAFDDEILTNLQNTIVHITKCPTSILLESTDSTEYLALNADKKAIYNLLISAGTLDMSIGTKARNLILTWIFPVGTLTNTAITSALAE